MNADLSALEIALLDDAGAVQDLSIAYGTVRSVARLEDPKALVDLTKASMLKLHDRGLILFFRASRETGYQQDLALVNPLTRRELENEFEADRDPSFVPDEDDFIFFVQTDAGRELFESLRSESAPRRFGRFEGPSDS